MKLQHRATAAFLATVSLGDLQMADLLAQDRPSESDLFGAPDSAAETPPAVPPEPGMTPEGDVGNGIETPPAPQDPASVEESDNPYQPAEVREGALFGGPSQGDAALNNVPDDPLRIGGQLYLRLLTTLNEYLDSDDTYLEQITVASPILADLYLDARPNDRVRGMLVGRFQYNRTDSKTLLDQAWLRFDLDKTVFLTVGKQHIKWGTARFWNPTDLLQPVRRNPLEPFDVRTGVTMIKLHLPWEKRGWNLYGIALLEPYLASTAVYQVDKAEEEGRDPATLPHSTQICAEDAFTVDRAGAALRAEVVLGTVEFGLDGLLQKCRKPRMGVDFSAGIGPLDITGEALIKRGQDTVKWEYIEEPVDGQEYFEPLPYPTGWTPAVTLGASWTFQYSDSDTATLGAEVAYDHTGYTDPQVYPWLILGVPGGFTPFYLGRYYAGAYLAVPGPGNWNEASFTLSTLANVSDRSFLSRLDFSLAALTHLRVEAFVGVHTGTRGGEFRFLIDPTAFGVPEEYVDEYIQAAAGYERLFTPPIVDLGLSLRINL